MNADRKRDLIAALAFLILGLTCLLFLIPRGVAVPSSVKVAALSPDFWPSVITYGCIIAAVFLLIETFTMQQPGLEEDDAEEQAQYQFDTLPAALRTITLIVALFAFYASLTTVGVVAASIVLMFAMMLFYGERNILIIAALSFGIPVLLYLFFRYIAGVPIPLGIFGT